MPVKRAALSLIAVLPLASAPARADEPAKLWNGFYFGLSGGYGGNAWADRDLEARLAPPLFTTVSWSHGAARAAGFMAGGQLGYNWRFDNQVVIGVESDAQWSDVGRAAHGVTGQPGAFSVGSRWARLDWFGATRLRAGYAVGRLLPYLTAGVAYGDISVGAEGVAVDPALGVMRIAHNSQSQTRLGWTLGAGAEYALARNLSAKTEYLYTEFGGLGAPTTALYLAPTPSVGSGASSVGRLGLHMVRAGLNYNFSAGGDLASASFSAAGVDPHDWTGFYAGMNGGYGGGIVGFEEQRAQIPAGVATASSQTARAGGFVVGGQAGFNRQFANGFVLGVETDAQWSDIRGSNVRALYALAAPPVSFAADPRNGERAELSWFGATRARLGYGFDRMLPYVTGGVAYGGVSARTTAAGLTVGGVSMVDLYDAAASEVRAGWTLGGGLEYAITDSLSFKTQYDYLALGGLEGTGTGAVTTGASTIGGVSAPINTLRVGAVSTGLLGFHIVRAGVNWRFNPTP